MSHIAAVERKDHLERGIFPLLPALIILVISRKIIIAPSELRRILAVEENLSKKHHMSCSSLNLSATIGYERSAM